MFLTGLTIPVFTMTKANLVASLTTPLSPDGQELSALPESVEWLEVRADISGDLDPDWLRSRFGGRLLYALRSRAAGGAFEGSHDQRHVRLRRAARAYDLVELDGESDLTPNLLTEIPVVKRLVSWHGANAGLSDLKVTHARLSAVPASLYKLVTRAANYAQELSPLSLLDSLCRADTIAYSTGPLGFWNRLIAPRLGAPFVYGLVHADPTFPAEPSINKLIEDYGLPNLPPLEAIFGIVGSPVFHSLSPRLHNAAYRAINYSALFVPFHVENFVEFWREVVEGSALKSLNMPIKGLTVASPHKEAALLTTKAVSPMSLRAGSANILVQNNGSWKADTTDPEVVFRASRERGIQLKRKRAAVIGCGGAGRAIATALAQSEAGVTLVNRGAERGHYAAQLLGFPYIPLSGFSAEGYDIVVNATPVGRDDGEVPFNIDTLSSETAVIDLVYGSAPTPLVAGAMERGLPVIDGREVLLTQVLHQFRLMTDEEMPASLVRENLGFEAETSDLIIAG